MVIFICGAPNAGKSTVGKILATRMQTAFVEGDDVRKIFYDKLVEEVRPQIVECIAALVRVLAGREKDIVVAYPLWDDDYEPLLSQLKDIKADLRFVALNPKLEVAVTNRGTRELEAWEVTWIRELYGKGVNNPSFAQSIDNTKMAPEECADAVEKLLGLK